MSHPKLDFREFERRCEVAGTELTKELSNHSRQDDWELAVKISEHNLLCLKYVDGHGFQMGVGLPVGNDFFRIFASGIYLMKSR